MASKPFRPCRHPGCSKLTKDGYCQAHKVQKAQRKESAEWHWMYGTPEWPKLRAAQFLREPFCRECARLGIRTRATVVDHIVPHRGNWALFIDPANHQSLCEQHHNRKTAREMAERRRKK